MKYIAALFAVLFITGCNNTTYHRQIGKGPINLSDPIQRSFDEYLDSNPAIFAVTEDGATSYGYYYCPEFNGCRGNNFLSMAPAIKSCEEHSQGMPCKVYAIGSNIVWKDTASPETKKLSTSEHDDPLSATKLSCKKGNVEDCALTYKSYYKKHRSIINDIKARGKNNEVIYKNSEIEAVVACENGSSKNCQHLGNKYYLWHKNLKNQQEKAEIDRLRIECKKHNRAESCNELGNIYNIKERAPKLALPYYKDACHIGFAASCAELGSIYRRAPGSVRQDNAKALEFLERACDLNSSKGCKLLGDMYKTGIYVEQNSTKANQLYKKSASLN
ncbi:tetratricopeptide repeat protein [Kiloniella majae]|uniref:tetratricopeptide repeat protein n=1 Tax=Kiloniella majae TaxID=1938558 RepID=UPI000A277911|nr:tetratricopeptide repeat protein [Kiloniella majae]